MSSLNQIAVVCFALISVFAALCFVLDRHPLRQSLAIAFHSLGVAGLFWIMGAAYIGMTSLLIGLLATLVFAVFVGHVRPMESRREPSAAGSARALAPVVVAFFVAALFGVMVWVERSRVFAKGLSMERESTMDQIAHLGANMLNRNISAWHALMLVVISGAFVVGLLHRRSRDV